MTQKRKSIGVVEEDCGSPARAALCTTAASTSTTADEKNTQAVFETTPPLWTTAPAEKKAKIACAAAVVSSSSSSTPNGGSNNAAAAQAQPSSTEPQPPGPPKTASNRCSACRNKVGLLGFRCCCGETFCGTHRYAEKHACSFDYKRAGRERIANNNLVVIDKIAKI